MIVETQFDDIQDGQYSMYGLTKDEQYSFIIKGNDATLWYNGKKNQRVTKKLYSGC